MMTPFVPPMPALADDSVGAFGVLARLSRNALTAFPSRCLGEAVVRLRIPGCTLVLASGPDAVREILQTRAVDYGRLPAARRVLGPIVGRGLLVSEGEAWRRQRRAMAPAFTPRSVPVIAHHVVTSTDAFLARLDDGGDTDLVVEMQRLSLDIAAVTMFSLDSASFGTELRRMVSGYMTTYGRLVPSDFLMPAAALPTLRSWRRSRFRKRWLALIGALVAERRAQAPAVSEAPRDLFDLMATAHGEGREDLLADEVATMIVAGHETTALALFWAFQILAQVPQWQEEIAHEASRFDLSPAHAAASLPGLMVTQAVIQETMRLYPPAFMTARRTNRATVVCGVTVPKSAIVPRALLPAASQSKPLAYAGSIRPEEVFGCDGTGPLLLSTIRGRPERVHRIATRYDRGGPSFGSSDVQVSCQTTAGRRTGISGWDRHNTPGSISELLLCAALTPRKRVAYR